MERNTLIGLTLIVSLLLAYFIFFHPLIPSTIEGAPQVYFLGWFQYNERVQVAEVGKPVELRLRAVAPITGSQGILRVEIKKDIIAWPDQSIGYRDFELNLLPSQEQVIVVEFTPDQPTNPQGIIGSVREYFYKLYWNNIPIYDPQTPLERNGLQVAESGGDGGGGDGGGGDGGGGDGGGGGEGELEWSFVGWYVNGVPRAGTQIQVQVGDTVTARFQVKAVGGDVSGTFTVEIRRDIVWSPDLTLGYYPHSVSLVDGESAYVDASFIADSPTPGAPFTMRQYFFRVWWNDNIIYDPQDPATREAVYAYG